MYELKRAKFLQKQNANAMTSNNNSTNNNHSIFPSKMNQQPPTNPSTFTQYHQTTLPIQNQQISDNTTQQQLSNIYQHIPQPQSPQKHSQHYHHQSLRHQQQHQQQRQQQPITAFPTINQNYPYNLTPQPPQLPPPKPDQQNFPVFNPQSNIYNVSNAQFNQQSNINTKLPPQQLPDSRNAISSQQINQHTSIYPNTKHIPISNTNPSKSEMQQG